MSDYNEANTITSKDLFVKWVDKKTGVYHEVDMDRGGGILKHQIFDREGQELERRGPYAGYPKNMSELEILRKEQQEETRRKQEIDRVFSHNHTIEGMIFHLNRAREDMSNVIERLHKHVLMLESDKKYRQINVEDYFVEENYMTTQKSHSKDLIKEWELFKNLTDQMQAEIDRLRGYDSLKQNKK